LEEYINIWCIYSDDDHVGIEASWSSLFSYA